MRPPPPPPGAGSAALDRTEVLPRDPPEPAPDPPRSAEADRLLALWQAPKADPGPMVQLDRARVAERPGDLTALEEWARGEERWSTVVEVLALRGRAESGPRRVELYLEAATVAVDALSRFDVALQLAEAARGPRPVPAVLRLLVDLYGAVGRPGEAIAALEMLLQGGHVQRADQPEVGARLAGLSASPRLDPATRLSTLRRASSLDRGNTGLREALVRALDETKTSWPAQTTVLPPSDAELAGELAELALARPLTDPEAVALLRRSLAHQEDAEVRDALMRALIAGGRFAELESELEARVHRTSGAAKVEALCALADAAARPPWSRPDVARDAYGNALALDPDCDRAFAWLLQDAREHGEWARIDRLVTRVVVATMDPARRNAVRSQVLPIWAGLGDWDRVSRTLRGLLVDDPHDRTALSMCEQMLGGDEWERGLMALVASADSPRWSFGEEQQRAEVVAACLRVANARGAPGSVVLPIASRLLQLRSQTPGLADAIRAMRVEAGCDDRAVATVRSRVDGAPTDTERAEALCDLGQLHRERWELGDAWTAYERALTIDPTHPDALEALAELAREPEFEERTEAVLRRRLVSIDAGRLPADQAHAALQVRRDVLHQVAELTTDEDEALVLLGRCLEIDPADRTAADEITRILTKKGDAFALAVHLDGRLQHVDAAGRVALGKRLAKLLGRDLAEPAAAVTRWEQVAEVAPADDIETPLALADAHVAAGHAGKAIDRWTALAASVPAGAVRTDLLRRIARATREPAARAIAYRRVLGAAPDDREALRELAAHYASRREGAFARELSHRLAKVSTDPEEQIAALLEACVHEDHEEAARTLRAAMAIDPARGEVLVRMEEASRQLGDWRGVIDVLERQLAMAASAADALDLAVAVASIWSERFGQDEAAARSLERARRIDPRSDRMLGQLEVLYDRAEDWPALGRVLRARLERAANIDEQVERLSTLARLHADRLAEPDVAVELYRAAAQLDPRRRELEDLQIDALAAAGAWDKVLPRLEARANAPTDATERAEGWLLVCDLAERATRRPAVAFEAACRVARELGPTEAALSLLSHCARRAGRQADAVAMLDELASHTPDAEAGARALACAAIMLERDLDAPSNALDRYLEILRRVGAGPRVAAEIERLALQEGRIDDWVSAELEREKLATNRSERVALLQRAARALDSIQGHPGRAFDLLLRALAVDPDDDEVADQLDQLADDLDESEGGRARARLAEAHAKLGEHGVWHLQRALASFEAVGRPQQAFDVAAALALATPDDAEVRAALPRLAADGARWGELLSVYDELAGLVTDREVRLSLRWEQACLLQDQMGRLQPARALLTEVLLERPSTSGLHARAIETARSSGQGREMAQALEDRLGELSRPDRLAALRWLADVWSVVLDEPAEVARLCEELLIEAPSDARALELVSAAYPKLGRWDRLAELVWARATGPDGTAEDAAQAAELFMARLGDPVRALTAWRRATDRDPSQLAWLGSYASLLERAGDWAELVRVLAATARGTASASERVRVLLRRAKVLAEKLGDRDEAIRVLEEARGLDPSSVEVLRDLEKFYELVGRWHDLASLRSDAADRVEDPADAREVLLRLARGLEAHGDVDGAIDALWRAIAVTPEYVPTYGRLRQLLAERGTPEQLVDLLLREAVAWTDPAESSERLCEAAAIVDRQLDDPDRARGLYREAIEANERCRTAAKALAEDAERRNDIQEAISWLESLRRWTVAPEDVARIDRKMERLLARAATRIVRSGR